MTTATFPHAASAPRAPRQSFDLTPLQRGLIGIVGGGFSVACTLAVTRAIAGFAPAHAGIHDLAVMIHVSTVMPALVLGAWLMLARKGTPRHKQLGKLWVVLMVATAISALFIRQINPGAFSPIHLFVPLTLHGAWKAVAIARRGDFAAHKRGLVQLYLGAMIIPGLFAFMPGRLFGTWLFG